LLLRVNWELTTDGSGQIIGTSFKGQTVFKIQQLVFQSNIQGPPSKILEDGIDILSRNVGNYLFRLP